MTAHARPHWHQPHACAPVPYGTFKAIVASLSPGLPVLVRPQYIARLSSAAQTMGVRITRRLTITEGRELYCVELAKRQRVASKFVRSE